MLTWIRRLFKRNPDRYPEWRPDQILTPENRTITRADYFPTDYSHLPPVRMPDGFVKLRQASVADWHDNRERCEQILLQNGWQRAGVDPDTGGPIYVRYREHG
ncbi:hypothetical protein PBI_TOAKA_37 [Mycobacterium phage Toaka]|nr:hypothetical protein PBI_TOAKA_37 [Mycobacterium phage Toaka]